MSLRLTLTDESCSPLKRRGIAKGNRVPERGRSPVLINGRKKSTRALFFQNLIDQELYTLGGEVTVLKSLIFLLKRLSCQAIGIGR